jgi:hypothetical protein
MFKKKYYIGHIIRDLNDGGQSRNRVFYNFYKQKDYKFLNVYNKNKFIRFFFIFRFLLLLIRSKNCTFFIHQNSLQLIFFKPILNSFFLRNLFFFFLKENLKSNIVTIEVNDLIFEQSIDLGLDVNYSYKKFQKSLFGLKNCCFIFASKKMKEYVCLEYNLDENRGKVIVNGANELNLDLGGGDKFSWEKSKNCKFVYAGTLNKGRQIEELICLFEKSNDILVLLGSGGDWIRNFGLPKNIFYLGDYKENIAQLIVSKCDVGLIPYDSSKFYYNLCFPTKISFYLVSGITVLSTPLDELRFHFEGCDFVNFVKFEDWAKVIDNISFKNLVIEQKSLVKIYGDKFIWTNLLKTNFL